MLVSKYCLLYRPDQLKSIPPQLLIQSSQSHLVAYKPIRKSPLRHSTPVNNLSPIVDLYNWKPLVISPTDVLLASPAKYLLSHLRRGFLTSLLSRHDFRTPLGATFPLLRSQSPRIHPPIAPVSFPSHHSHPSPLHISIYPLHPCQDNPREPAYPPPHLSAHSAASLSYRNTASFSEIRSARDPIQHTTRRQARYRKAPKRHRLALRASRTTPLPLSARPR